MILNLILFLFLAQREFLKKENAGLKILLLEHRTQQTKERLEHMCRLLPTYWLRIQWELQKIDQELKEIK